MPTGNMVVPVPHIEDQPTVSLCINQDWAGVLIGQIWGLRYPEAWAGTLEENRRARNEIQNLIAMLSSFEGCPDMSTFTNCCVEIAVMVRINVQTGRFERSLDQGTTWSPDPSDPMFSVVQQPAPVTDGVNVTKCDAATNFTAHFQDVINKCSEDLGTATSAAQLGAGIAAFLLDVFIIAVTGGAAAPVVIGITTAIFGAINAAFLAGKAGFDAYWDGDKTDIVLCAAYATIGVNGQWDETTWNNFRTRIKIDLPAQAARDMVLTSVNAAGYVGANNMASYGASALADCSSCGDCLNECQTVWTFFGVHDVVFDGCNTYTVKANGGGEHVAFSSGNSTIGCYMNGILGSFSYWPLGSASPVGGANPEITAIWNADFGNPPAETVYVFEFSSSPFA